MKRVLPLLSMLLIVAIAFCAYAPFWSICSEVEQKVDKGEFQARQQGDGWFVFAPSGFSKTGEYLSHFAGMLAKRNTLSPDGWEKYKLASVCGGSLTVAGWAKIKRIGSDGQKLPRLANPGQGLGGFAWSFTIGGAILLAAIMVMLHLRRRRFEFGS